MRRRAPLGAAWGDLTESQRRRSTDADRLGNNLPGDVSVDVNWQEAEMSTASDRPGRPGRPILSPLRGVAVVCIVAPFVAMLWIPSYNKTDPKLLGFPFFYWYQLLWVVITAVLMVIAVQAVKRDSAARRGSGSSGDKDNGTDVR